MYIIQSLLLGLIQGLCEFFPVSSSAHLKLVKHFFENTNFGTLFDLSCHLGTLGASVIFLRKELLLLLTKDRKSILLIFIAIIPLVPMYFLYRYFQTSFNNIHFLGVFFILSSILLFSMSYSYQSRKNESSNPIKDVLFIGLMQAVALIPGISRSGSTIWAAKKRKWQVTESIKFSFILAIPTILGGIVLESHKSLTLSDFSTYWHCYLIGFLSSFIIGIFAIRILFSIISFKQFLPFAWYCLIIGVGTLVYFNLLS